MGEKKESMWYMKSKGDMKASMGKKRVQRIEKEYVKIEKV